MVTSVGGADEGKAGDFPTRGGDDSGLRGDRGRSAKGAWPERAGSDIVGDERVKEQRRCAPVERAVEDVDDGSTGEAWEEIMVDALPPEVVDLEQEGKVDVRAEAHAVVQDVVVSEAPEVPEPEVKSEEVVVRDTTKVHPAHQPETKADEVLVRDTDTAVVVQEPEAKGEVSWSREAAGAQTTEYDDCIRDCDTAVERGRELHAGCADFKMVSRTLTRKATALVKLAKSSKDYDVAIETFQKALTEHQTQIP
ncbi:hsp70-Hsp90 organizing protein 1-like [Triticum dicoccoides]|uniref:hsp70-Hsp90 organizing protein 1-like n=1 Tax=Triticum dicoccoides TaxID=85692 RepID=UPI00188F51DF|nr:hsp70-Hsp90 organizing protein 1-like [Triticum dicoccoides]